MDSEDEPYSFDDVFNCFDDSDNPVSDDQLPDSVFDSDSGYQLLENSHKKYYRILKENEIQQSQEKDIALLSSTLSIPRAAAGMVLHYYKWNVENALEAWFNDGDRVRKSVGLMEKPTVGNDEEFELVCGICFEIYVPDSRLESTVGFCGHHFCSVCLATYVQIAINDGPAGCLFLRCPDPSCVAVVGEDMVDLLVSDEYRNKYKGYLVRSYIEENPKTKWCPAPDCGCAIEYELGSERYDVLCHCSCKFCWNCSEDAHSPVDCHTVAKWILKNSLESENVNWILANSKPCPKCKVPIEKNHGCMHMTCRKPCGYHFCWLCLGPWAIHGERTGGYCEYNIFEKAKQEGRGQDTVREMAKASLERYTHYYEKWEVNHKSREKARADLHELNTVQLHKLQEKFCQTAGQLDFVTDAWVQIIESRRVLKWTYAYGYYLPEHQSAKTKLFEFLQSKAEAALEKLQKCAEQELKTFLENGHTDEFNTDFFTHGCIKFNTDFRREPYYLADEYEFNIDFRQKLRYLTGVTRNFFGNLVRVVLKNDLSDVNCA